MSLACLLIWLFEVGRIQTSSRFRFSLASRSFWGGGGRRPPLGQGENYLPVFREMLSRSYGTPVVYIGERREFSHSLTLSLPPPPDGVTTCAVLSETCSGASLRQRPQQVWKGELREKSGSSPNWSGRDAGFCRFRHLRPYPSPLGEPIQLGKIPYGLDTGSPWTRYNQLT